MLFQVVWIQPSGLDLLGAELVDTAAKEIGDAAYMPADAQCS
jgi:hypothetical protein